MPPSDFRCEQRPKPLPPRTNGLVANVGHPLVQQILNFAERQRELDLHHHRQMNDLGARLEVAMGSVGSSRRLGTSTYRFKRSSFENNRNSSPAHGAPGEPVRIAPPRRWRWSARPPAGPPRQPTGDNFITF